MKIDPDNYSVPKDIANAAWFLEKLQDKAYAQNVYAAICNNRFFKSDDSLAILTEDCWTASWRVSGEIIAKLRNRNEDYIDYYCSGLSYDLEEDLPLRNYVEEGLVTEEVREDFIKLGWIIKPYD